MIIINLFLILDFYEINYKHLLAAGVIIKLGIRDLKVTTLFKLKFE